MKASGIFKQHPGKPGKLGKPDQPPKAEPDWDTFAVSLRDTFDAGATEPRAQACEFLRDSPPNRQVIVAGAVAWETPSCVENETDIEFLLRMVRAIRNNLFHGGKYNLDLHESAERTEKLLRSSLTILNACLNISPIQKATFLDARL